MRALALLTAGWCAFALFLLFLTYQPWPLIFWWVDPAELARWEACKALRDTWMGGPT